MEIQKRVNALVGRSKLRNMQPRFGCDTFIKGSSIAVAACSDTTGSQSSVITTVRDELTRFLSQLAKRYPALEATACFYRDHTPFVGYDVALYESPVGRSFAPVSDLVTVQRFIEEHATCGGGGYAEAMGMALHALSRLRWSARYRIVLHAGDRPSHGFHDYGGYDSLDLCPRRLTHEDIVGALKAKHIRAFMVLCGRDPWAEKQYRRIAKETGGRFIRLEELSASSDLLVFLEGALLAVTGGNVRALLEGKQRRGELPAPTVRALLASFDEE